VASASGQCSRPHSIECASVSHEKRDDNDFAPPIPGPGTLCLLPVSKNEEESVSRM